MCTVLAFGIPFETIAKNIFGEILEVFRTGIMFWRLWLRLQMPAFKLKSIGAEKNRHCRPPLKNEGWKSSYEYANFLLMKHRPSLALDRIP